MKNNYKWLFIIILLIILGAGGNIQWNQLATGAKHGTGSKGQSSDGTGANGHLASYDSSGNVTDSGLTVVGNGVTPTQSVQSWNYTGAGGPFQVIQTTSCEANTTTCTTPAINVTATHLLVVTVSSFGISTPTSSKSDTFSAATGDPADGVNQRIWYTCSAVGGSTTFTMSGGGRAVHVHVIEFNGNATSSCLDVSNQTGGSSTSLTVTTSGSVTSGNEIVVASFNSNFGSCNSITVGSGTTQEVSTISTGTASGNWPVITSIYNQNTGLTGAITMTATCNASTSNTNANIASFKLTSPASSGTVPNFDFSVANTFKITLVNNVVSSTTSNQVAGLEVAILICQDSLGSHTFTWPTTVKGAMVIGSTASKCNVQMFVSDGTTLYAVASGITNE